MECNKDISILTNKKSKKRKKQKKVPKKKPKVTFKPNLSQESNKKNEDNITRQPVDQIYIASEGEETQWKGKYKELDEEEVHKISETKEFVSESRGMENQGSSSQRETNMDRNVSSVATILKNQEGANLSWSSLMTK